MEWAKTLPQNDFRDNLKFSVGSLLGRGWRTLWKKPSVFFGLTFWSFFISWLITGLLVNDNTSLYEARLDFGALFGIRAIFSHGIAASAAYQILTCGEISIWKSVRRSFSKLPVAFVIAAVVLPMAISLVTFCAHVERFSPIILFPIYLWLILPMLLPLSVCVIEDLRLFKNFRSNKDRIDVIANRYHEIIMALAFVAIGVIMIFAIAAELIIPRYLNGVPRSCVQMILYVAPAAFVNMLWLAYYYELRLSKIKLMADIFD
jgi:hypothetical protein